MTYSFNPQGDWTSRHQMSLNGKRDNFTIEDFKACAKNASMKRGRAEDIVRQVQEAILQWMHFADESGVSPAIADSIKKAHRSEILI
jgi:serine/threonine-protein kinase HipA